MSDDAPGPITVVTRAVQRKHPAWLALVLRAWPLLPAACLPFAPEPGFAELAGRVLGYDATLCLVACLTVTPLVSVAPTGMAPLRRWYGIWVFTLGLAGLIISMTNSEGNPLDRIAGNSVNWSGTLIVAMLGPLTAISTVTAQKLLGPEWKRWMRWLTWAAWWVIALHLLALRSWMTIIPLLMATIPLALVRRPWLRRRVREWRRDGYSSGAMWLGLDACAVLLVSGTAWLIGLEVLACAGAFA